MSRADETAAQPTETPDEAQSTDCTTPLPRRFLATASGPVTRITDHSDKTTERVRADISLEYSIETLEEFATFWSFRDYRSWKRAALEALLERQEPDAVTYAVDEDDLEEWVVTVDGRVEAFAELVEMHSLIRWQLGLTRSPMVAKRLTTFSRSLLTSFTGQSCGGMERTSLF